MNKTALNSQKEKHSMLSLRRATFVGLAAHRLRNISIHALLAESDADNGDAGNGCDAISIHALLAESDYWLPVRHSRTEAFLSTLSLRRATHCIWILCRQHPDFYPRSPCGERRGSSSKSTRCFKNFYPRSPCGERRVVHVAQDPVQAAFLSTLSLRRATLPETAAVVPSRNFYPRSPCGERREVIAVMTEAQSISIHALLAESDRKPSIQVQHPLNFYPRSPCGERRFWRETGSLVPFISIHALLAESDTRTNRRPCQRSISIHALLAESDGRNSQNIKRRHKFLSTLSLRRATSSKIISSSVIAYFYPRSPCGERLYMGVTVLGIQHISIQLSLRRATRAE